MKKRNYILLTAVPMLSALTFSVGAFAQTSPHASVTTKTASSMREGKGRGGHMGMHKGMHNTEDASTILGITETELKAQLSGGKTLDTIITEKGFTKESFHEKMKALREVEMKAKLTSDIASGKITQAQADKMVADRATHEAEMKTILAKALGISVAELDAYKASGTSVDTIITQKGLDKATVMKAVGVSRGNFDGNKEKMGRHGNGKMEGNEKSFLHNIKNKIKAVTQ